MMGFSFFFLLLKPPLPALGKKNENEPNHIQKEQLIESAVKDIPPKLTLGQQFKLGMVRNDPFSSILKNTSVCYLT
jgi:hypothetical protein